MTNFEKVKKFMAAFNQERGRNIFDSTNPAIFRLFKMRLDLMQEEALETLQASKKYMVNCGRNPSENSLEEIKESVVQWIDGLADQLYVIYGAFETFGFDADEAFNRVHISNMSKLGVDGKPIYREDGKVLKGENYSPPRLYEMVFPELVEEVQERTFWNAFDAENQGKHFVPIPAIRARLGWPKERFDNLLVKLRDSGKAQIHNAGSDVDELNCFRDENGFLMGSVTKL